MRRRELIHSVIAPPEASGEVGDRHHLDASDAELLQLRQLPLRSGPCSLSGKCADVHLVEHLPIGCHPCPMLIGPPKRAGVNNLRRTMRTFRLKTRSRIWIKQLAIVEAKTIV